MAPKTTMRVTGWDAKAREIRYTEKGHGANAMHPWVFSESVTAEELDSLDAARYVPPAVKVVVRMLAADPARRSCLTFACPYSLRITTGDDSTRVSREMGITLMCRDREVGSIPTRLIFGAGDESGRMSRGRDEEMHVARAVEWLRDCGLRIERADAGVWDDGDVTVTTLADATI